jgi:hypothetical protein
MNGLHRRATYVGTIALAAGCALAGVGLARAQPVPTDPVMPEIPSDQILQPGQLGSIGDIMSNFTNPNDIMTTMFPDPAVPYTPVREMPMGPPPPDPAFAPRP